ncbi:MAG: hypothetical protein PWQ91_160 [Eubacteriales bacterium]|nr:hypothetical protein [Eubacteriales bacterium]MDN5363099.1 hypothetical protein [Eubacteriales bacterium]
MQLAPGTRAIMAYFASEGRAEKAAAALRTAGFEEVQVEHISRYGESRDREMNNPVAGRAEALTGLTVYGEGMDRFEDNDVRALMAADPGNSGMAAHNYGLAGNKPYLLALLVREEEAEKAVRIIREHGGMV